MKTVNTPAKAFANTAAPTRGGRSVRLRRHDIRVKRNERSGTSDRLACWQPVVNRRRTIAAAATLVVLAAPAPASAARPKAPELTRIRCVPSTTATCKTSIKVTIGRQLQLSGKRVAKGMRVSFRWSRGALATKLDHTRVGYVARVPAGTSAGVVSVTVSDRAGRRSNAMKITVVAPPRIGGAGVAPGVLPDVFKGNGMWMWELASSDGGNLDTIAARAHAAAISTVFVKSSDGASDRWSQFNPGLVAALHAQGLHVCAWQFV